MSNSERSDYLQRRAAQERVAAKLAENAFAARSHSEMARRYSDLSETELVEGPEEEGSTPVLTPDFRIIP